MNTFALLQKVVYNETQQKNSEVPTPGSVIKAMYDKLDIDWTDPELTICDPVCGRGSFLIYAASQLKKHHRAEYIATEMLYGYDLDAYYIDRATTTIARELEIEPALLYNIKRQNSLESINMKQFSVIVGNPPYKKSMWKDFMLLAFKHSDCIAMVTPDSTDLPNNWGNKIRSLYSDNGIQFKKDCTASFPKVNSGYISYFIFDKTKKSKDIFNVDSIVVKISSKTTDTLVVTKGTRAAVETQPASDTPNNTLCKKVYMAVGKDGIKIQYTNPDIAKYNTKKKTHTEFADKDAKYFITNGFFAKNKINPLVEIPPMFDTCISGNVYAFKVDAKSTLEGFSSVMKSKVYLYAIGNMTGKGFDTQAQHFKLVPILDYSRVWTDREIYKHFDITKEEEKTIEAWYKEVIL